MKIHLEYGQGRQTIEGNSLTVTGSMLVSGDRILAEMAVIGVNLQWVDPQGKPIGAVIVEA